MTDVLKLRGIDGGRLPLAGRTEGPRLRVPQPKGCVSAREGRRGGAAGRMPGRDFRGRGPGASRHWAASVPGLTAPWRHAMRYGARMSARRRLGGPGRGAEAQANRSVALLRNLGKGIEPGSPELQF